MSDGTEVNRTYCPEYSKTILSSGPNFRNYLEAKASVNHTTQDVDPYGRIFKFMILCQGVA